MYTPPALIVAYIIRNVNGKTMNNDQITNQETATILELAKQCLTLPGDFVELGCYKGETSVLLGKLLTQSHQNLINCGKPVDNLCKNQEIECKTSVEHVENPCKTPSRRLWLYDSFAGLPEKTIEDASGAGQNFRAGELFVTKREVVEKIRRANLRNVVIKKAWFDDLTDQDLPHRIAFAFLDGDLYGSIKTSLKLVTPRLVKQGIMVVHDYNNPELPGSSRAVDEFLRMHPEYRLSVRHTLAILRTKC